MRMSAKGLKTLREEELEESFQQVVGEKVLVILCFRTYTPGFMGSVIWSHCVRSFET